MYIIYHKITCMNNELFISYHLGCMETNSNSANQLWDKTWTRTVTHPRPRTQISSRTHTSLYHSGCTKTKRKTNRSDNQLIAVLIMGQVPDSYEFQDLDKNWYSYKSKDLYKYQDSYKFQNFLWGLVCHTIRVYIIKCLLFFWNQETVP